MILEDSIELVVSSEQFSEIIDAYAATFHCAITKKHNRYLLKAGSLFSLNPNTIRHNIYIDLLDNGKIHMKFYAIFLPFISKKIKRILCFRLIQLKDFMKMYSKGMGSQSATMREYVVPFTVITENNVTPVIKSLIWILLSLLVSLLLTFVVSTLFGISIIYNIIDNITGHVNYIQQLGEISLPSPNELASIDFIFKVGCTVIFVAPIAFFISVVLSTFICLSEFIDLISNYTVWVITFLVIILFFSFVPIVNIILAIILSVSIPMVSYIGYSIIWGLKGEKRRSMIGEKCAISRKLGIFTAFLLAILLMIFYIYDINSKDTTKSIALFRDRFLMNSYIGRKVADFYYKHTLYPAYIIKSPEEQNNNIAFIQDTSNSSKIYSFIDTVFRGKNLRELVGTSILFTYYIGPLLLLFILVSPIVFLLVVIYKKKRMAFVVVAILGIVAMSILLLYPSDSLPHPSDHDFYIKISEFLNRGGEYIPVDIGYEVTYGMFCYLDKGGTDRNDNMRRLLLKTVYSEDLRVRGWACEALGLLEGEDVVNILITSLEKDPELYVRYHVANALGHILKNAKRGSTILDINQRYNIISALKNAIRNDWWYVGMYSLEAVRGN